ncbi:MAG: hypothetical protein NVS2B7_23970 [Herpetosiphon sp.]
MIEPGNQTESHVTPTVDEDTLTLDVPVVKANVTVPVIELFLR